MQASKILRVLATELNSKKQEKNNENLVEIQKDQNNMEEWRCTYNRVVE